MKLQDLHFLFPRPVVIARTRAVEADQTEIQPAGDARLVLGIQFQRASASITDKAKLDPLDASRNRTRRQGQHRLHRVGTRSLTP